MHCRHCGTPLEPDAASCARCGETPLTGRAFCQGCGAETRESQELCMQCGAGLVDLSGLSDYYRKEFHWIHESHEGYKGKWNWAAFLFGPIWALTKGIWLAPLIALAGGLLTYSIVMIAYWFVFGARGNYMYYTVHVKGRQLPI